MEDDINYKGYLKSVREWYNKHETKTFVMATYSYFDAVKIANFLRNNGFKATIKTPTAIWGMATIEIKR